MGIHFALARRSFQKEQEKLRRQYRKAGMTEEQIQDMYEFDLQQFNRDIAFYRRNQSLTACEEMMREEGLSPLLKKYYEQLTVVQQPSCEGKRWWLDEIEDEALLSCLMRLSEEDLEVVHRLAFCDCTQKELCAALGRSQSALSQKLKTIRKKLSVKGVLPGG